MLRHSKQASGDGVATLRASYVLRTRARARYAFVGSLVSEEGPGPARVGGRLRARELRLRGKEGESLQAGWSVDGRWERSSDGSAQDVGRVIVPIASSAPATAPSARFSPFACLLRIQLKLRCITPP